MIGVVIDRVADDRQGDGVTFRVNTGVPVSGDDAVRYDRDISRTLCPDAVPAVIENLGVLKDEVVRGVANETDAVVATTIDGRAIDSHSRILDVNPPGGRSSNKVIREDEGAEVLFHVDRLLSVAPAVFELTMANDGGAAPISEGDIIPVSRYGRRVICEGRCLSTCRAIAPRSKNDWIGWSAIGNQCPANIKGLWIPCWILLKLHLHARLDDECVSRWHINVINGNVCF